MSISNTDSEQIVIGKVMDILRRAEAPVESPADFQFKKVLSRNIKDLDTTGMPMDGRNLREIYPKKAPVYIQLKNPSEKEDSGESSDENSDLFPVFRHPERRSHSAGARGVSHPVFRRPESRSHSPDTASMTSAASSAPQSPQRPVIDLDTPGTSVSAIGVV